MGTVHRLEEHLRRPVARAALRPLFVALRCQHGKIVAQLQPETNCVIIKQRAHYGRECVTALPLAGLLDICERWRAGEDAEALEDAARALECSRELGL